LHGGGIQGLVYQFHHVVASQSVYHPYTDSCGNGDLKHIKNEI
jgi:hypothetical protein